MKSFLTIPFKIESEHGMTTVEGLAKISPAGIVLEFEKKLFGILNDGVKEARIPISEIIDFKLKSGIFNSKLESYFSNKLELRLNNLSRTAGLPYKDGKFKMKIKRADRELAEQAVRCIFDAKMGGMPPPDDTPKFPDATPIEQVFIQDESDTLEFIERK